MPSTRSNTSKATAAVSSTVPPTTGRKRQSSGADQTARKRLRSGSNRTSKKDLEEGEEEEEEKEEEEGREEERKEEGKEEEEMEEEMDEEMDEEDEDKEEADLADLEEDMVVDKPAKGGRKGKKASTQKWVMVNPARYVIN